MSLKKKRQLKKENRLKACRDSLAGETGLYFSQELSSESQGFPFLKYVVNALALFGGTFGSIDCLVSSFELDVSIMPLFLTCVVFSVILSFMYVSYKAKVITYIFILIGSVTLSMSMFVLLNSGISALRNNILSYINNKSTLPYLREYTLYYNNEYVSMSAALCIIALAFMILLNILISEKMSLRGLFIITFPAVQFGMYFNYNTSKVAMLCVVTSWVLVAGVRFTNAYDGLNHKMVSASSVKKHRHYYSFVTDSKNVSKIAVVWLMFILLVTGVVFAAIPSQGFDISLKTDYIKDSTERVVKNFLSYGMSSMFSMDRNSTSPGQLSNVEAISFDGRTDLEVTMVDYRASRVYIRNYVGYDYDPASVSWVSKNEESNDNNEKLFNASSDLLEYDYNHGQLLTQSRHKIGIRVVDSGLWNEPLEIAYYSVLDGDDYEYKTSGEVYPGEDSDITESDTRYYTFYTVDKTPDDYDGVISEIAADDEQTKAEMTDAESEAREDAFSNALNVPETNLRAIETFCKAYNISADDEDVVTEVIEALENNYEYTLRPGKVPYGEDYVNYFLLGSQKGYCQHFASAATLIFRYLGIPARYAEGYAIDSEDFYSAESERDLDFDEWISTPYRSDSEVMTVSVPDSNGHAWVEIYVDGFGWMPVEATTAAAAEDNNSLINSIFGRNSTLSDATRNIVNAVRSINTATTKAYIIRLVFILIALAFIIYILRIAVTVVIRHRSFSTASPETNVSNMYRHVCKVYGFGFGGNTLCMSYIDFISLLSGKGWLLSGPDELCTNIESLLFSGETPDEVVYTSVKKELAYAEKQVFRNMKPGKKFTYLFIKVLW